MSIDNIGEYIRNARINKAITQEDLAEMLDITPTHVKHIESGHRKPSVPILFSLAKILGMSIDNVIFDSVPETEMLIKEINNNLTKLNIRELKIIYDLINSVEKNRNQK